MKIIRTLALAAFVGSVTPALVWAQVGPPPTPPVQERPMKRELPPEVKEVLERQRAEIRALRQKHREERRGLRQKLREERKDRGAPGIPPEKSTP